MQPKFYQNMSRETQVISLLMTAPPALKIKKPVMEQNVRKTILLSPIPALMSWGAKFKGRVVRGKSFGDDLSGARFPGASASCIRGEFYGDEISGDELSRE